MEKLKVLAEQMLQTVEELQHWKQARQQMAQGVTAPVQGMTKSEVLDSHNLYILQLLSSLDSLNEQIAVLAYSSFADVADAPSAQATALPKPLQVPVIIREEKEIIPIPGGQQIPSPVQRTVSLEKGNYSLVRINKKQRKSYIKELGLDAFPVKHVLRRKGPLVLEQPYTIYQESFYGKLANFFLRGISLRLSKRHFRDLRQSVVRADIHTLSTTYVSSMLFTTFLVFAAAFAGIFAFGIFLGSSAINFNLVLRSSGIALLSALIAYFLYFTAPLMIANHHKRVIKNDLPFVIIHMAAVAGSGAQPVSMFHLVLSTGEYKGVEREIKKILNYVNLFGYSLSSALRAVSITTPNKDFKDLLNGIVSVIESGGDLKFYLKGKADDAFTNYKLERKRYVEALSTYSDIYIGVLLAAPLLFIVTLTIINLLGGTIAGFSVRTLAFFGTFVGMPLLNIAFLVFLQLVQPEV